MSAGAGPLWLGWDGGHMLQRRGAGGLPFPRVSDGDASFLRQGTHDVTRLETLSNTPRRCQSGHRVTPHTAQP